MATERFRVAEDAYLELRGQFDSGRITEKQFGEKLRELMVQDSQGRYWTLGAETGTWYVYDGQNWVQGDPLDAPAAVPAAQARAPAAPAPSTAMTPDTVRGFPLLLILVVVSIIAVTLCAILLFLNRERIFVAQVPPAPGTPNLLATRTSEPDFFNTNTPVPSPFVTPPDIATREPTAPLVIVIPTQEASSNIPTVTPFAVTTPVAQPPAAQTLPSLPTGRLRVGNGPDARARYMPLSQFSLDGNFSEWSGEGVPLTIPHFGAENWGGPGDLSGTAWLGWNENFLLIAVNVVDDAHVQTQRSWEMFRGDSVELWIDADLEGDFDVAAGNADDYQLGFSPGDFAGLGPEGVVYIPFRDAIVNQQILVAAQPNAAGYTLEAAVPWAVLRVQPGQGRAYGYSVDLSDNDVPLTAQQQTQVTHDPNFQFQVPTTFGNLILE